MSSCTCDFGVMVGPAVRAAGFLRRIQARADGKKRRGDDGTTRDVLDILSGRLEGGRPVLFEFAHWAGELHVPVTRLREVPAWLVEHEFVALEGDVDGIARLWGTRRAGSGQRGRAARRDCSRVWSSVWPYRATRTAARLSSSVGPLRTSCAGVRAGAAGPPAAVVLGRAQDGGPPYGIARNRSQQLRSARIRTRSARPGARTACQSGGRRGRSSNSYARPSSAFTSKELRLGPQEGFPKPPLQFPSRELAQTQRAEQPAAVSVQLRAVGAPDLVFGPLEYLLQRLVVDIGCPVEMRPASLSELAYSTALSAHVK